MRRLRGSSRHFGVAKMPSVLLIAKARIGYESAVVAKEGKMFAKYTDSHSATALYNAARTAAHSANLILNDGLPMKLAIEKAEGVLIIEKEKTAEFLVMEAKLVEA